MNRRSFLKGLALSIAAANVPTVFKQIGIRCCGYSLDEIIWNTIQTHKKEFLANIMAQNALLQRLDSF